MGPLITFHKKKKPAWCFPRVAPHRLKPKPPTTDTSLPVRQVEEYRHSRRKGRSDLRLQYIHCMHSSCKSFFFFSLYKPPTNYFTKSVNRKKKEKSRSTPKVSRLRQQCAFVFVEGFGGGGGWAWGKTVRPFKLPGKLLIPIIGVS